MLGGGATHVQSVNITDEQLKAMGIDPAQDPELAHAMRMSMEEEAAKAMSLEEPLNPEPPAG